jgi:hypothetical protein
MHAPPGGGRNVARNGRGLAAAKKIAAFVGLIAVLAFLAGSAGSANKTASLEGVGFADTDITFTEPGEAAAAADRDLQAGADTIAISFPVTADVGRIADDDLSHLCVAAGLAAAKHFELLARAEIRKADVLVLSPAPRSNWRPSRRRWRTWSPE